MPTIATQGNHERCACACNVPVGEQFWTANVTRPPRFPPRRDYYYNATFNSGDAFPQNYGLNKTISSCGECGVPYEALYAMPGTNHTWQWWSMDYGPVHFLQLDTELDMDNTSVQYKFAAADLAAVNRTKTPFVIVTLHRHMYW